MHLIEGIYHGFCGTSPKYSVIYQVADAIKKS
jgi:hypothetical protein